jgi:hypothetical protein
LQETDSHSYCLKNGFQALLPLQELDCKGSILDSFFKNLVSEPFEIDTVIDENRTRKNS